MNAFPFGNRMISDQLIRAENRPSGFDYLRLFLSIGVLLTHSIDICYGWHASLVIWLWRGPLHPMFYFIVPSFFALSGFLVAGSLERNTIPAFLTLRFIRIFPALCVEVLISALFLGTLLTSLSLRDYFSHPEFWRYLGNIVGWVHFDLPGVFENRSPPNRVNGSLWTVPFELDCYIAIAALGIAGLAKRPILFTSAAIVAMLALSAKGAFTSFFILGGNHPGGVLILSFLFGAAIYLVRKTLPFSLPLFVLSFTLSLVFFYFAATFYLATPFVAYSTAYIGLLNPRRMLLVRGADYSYGIYLYGYPFQQAAFQLLPGGTFWLLNIVYAVLSSGAAAYLSWTFVEKRVLERRAAALLRVAKSMEWLRLFFTACANALGRGIR
ncbi:MAG: acyltransferase [Mesorhizobium sp.]|uniref:acyltransferase family protein n=2 Tax=Mesorhizobium sp. TaxID=1871066 RepID=UPI000FE622E9|nr:MAG: acyltransferase [Mesorhizobium sp.]RWD11108.1 MAG: acyltransferase [Mesorhizobium sp.]RWE67110.1 MAG: acyltransferase [Mesorhizobium sp.]RWF90686.1 MAG: acyltransferase [Mesorhizobium sp.]RWI13060.1 MAG: acyltransferase [Mesorhizobium sp.]